MKLSEGAKDVLDYLIDNSIGEGIVSGDGKRKPEHTAPGNCDLFNFEENYDAPNGVAVVPNDFLPSSTGESMTLAVGRATTAGDYLKQNVVSVAALLNVLYVEMTALARSLINFHVDEATRKAKVEYQGCFAQTRMELFRAWVNAPNPDRKLITKVHTIIYGSFTKKVLNGIRYQIWLALKLWPKGRSGDQQCGKKAPQCPIMARLLQLVNDMVRQCFVVAKGTVKTHGLCLCNSVSKASGLKRADREKAKGLDLRRVVKGWKAPLHIAWVKEKHKSEVPCIEELEGYERQPIIR